MNSLNILVEAKKEYTNQLQKILTPRIYEGFKSIYEDILKVLTEEIQENKPQSSSVVKTFQKALKEIPQWNQDMIKNEYNRIEKTSNCDYFDNLIEAIFITNTKILTSVQIHEKSQNIKINIPQSPHFIHKCYMECAKEIYKNPYIFDQSKNLLPKEKHNNLRDTIHLIDNSINNAIRELLPIRDILMQGITKNNIEMLANLDNKNEDIEDSQEDAQEDAQEDVEEDVAVEETEKDTDEQEETEEDSDEEVEKEDSKKDNLEKSDEVFRKLQTPVAPHPGQALLEAAENPNLEEQSPLLVEENIIEKINSIQEGLIVESITPIQEEIKEIHLENIVQTVKKINSSDKINKQEQIQRLPVELVLDVSPIESRACERLQEVFLLNDETQLEVNEKEESPIELQDKEINEKEVVINVKSPKENIIQEGDLNLENNEKEKSQEINSDKFSGIPIRNAINKEDNPFIRNIKQKNFIKNKFVKSDRNTSFYKRKYEENSANFQSVSEHSNTVILDTDVKDDDTIISSKITKNKIELEGYSSNDDNEENAEDEIDL